MPRIQVIGDEVFFDNEKVAELRPGISTGNHTRFRDFLAEMEYEVRYEQLDFYEPEKEPFKVPRVLVESPRSPWHGITRV